MKRLFINYRAHDAGYAATLLYRELRDRLADHVFLDHALIEGGEVWPERLREEIAQADVVVALVGNQWLKTYDAASGERRINLTGDWVRLELETAHALKKAILPHLVDNAEPLSAASLLPSSLAWFASLQARPLRRTEFEANAEALVKLLGEQHGFTVRSAKRSDAARAEDLLPVYRQHVRERHSQLVRYFGGGKRPTLQEVFVETPLAAEVAPGMQFTGVAKDVLRAIARTKEIRVRSSQGDLVSVKSASRHWILRGDPGAGKSTLVRHLCHELAADPTAPIPVYLSVARWARDPGDVFDCAEASLARELGGQERAAGLAALLRERAAQPGAVWLFLDGFDELSGERVAELRDRIATLATNQACAVSIVVTARPYALPDFAAASPRLAPGTFGVGTIQPLSDARQRELLANWLNADRAAAVFAELQACELLADLCRNPLTLTWLALLMRVPGATLPGSRVELYERVVSVFLEDTPAVGGDDKPNKVQAHTDARQILAALALELQAADADGETWTRQQLVAALWQVHKVDVHSRVVQLWRGPDGFLDQVAARSGLLAEFEGPGEGWRFLHRSLREYLVAEALFRREKREEWLARARALTNETFPRWAEPFGLLCPQVPNAGAFILSLGQHNSTLAQRCLPEIDVPFAAGFGVLQQLEGWDGDDLLALMQSAMRRGEPASTIEAVLWPLVTPEQSLDLLAYVHFAMASAEIAVERARFFASCGRPIDGVPEIEFLPIPAGSFSMGSPDDDTKRSEDEGPVHHVTLSAFALARTEVTNAHYRCFDRNFEPKQWDGVNSIDLDAHPAVQVSWWHAYLFCSWIDARLPSESEWEYACRAGTKSPFSFGDSISPAQVNFNGRATMGDFRQRTVPVGSLPENPWGLCEMHGNVWEWCADRWHDNYEDAPSDGAARVRGGARDRVLRGGSWILEGRWCRSAFRGWWLPSARRSNVGFRPARFTTE